MLWKELYARRIRKQSCSVEPLTTRNARQFRRSRTAGPRQTGCPAGLEHLVLQGIARKVARMSDGARQVAVVAILGRRGLDEIVSKARVNDGESAY